MSNLPAQTDTPSLALPQSFRLTPTGLEVSGTPSFEEWLDCGQFIYKYNESIHFCIGDWLNYGELRWGETYRQAVLAFGFDVGTLRNDKWVAGRIPPERRKPELSFSHHQVVANLQPDRQDEMLGAALDKKLTRNEFRKFVDERVYMPVREPAAPEPSRQRDNAQGQQETTQDLTTLLTTANQLLTALGAIDFAILPEKERKDVFEQLGQVRNRIDGLFMNYDD